ncbi:MAG: long-chain fatty acid--CoA ligase [Ruminococcaceae bacterium]|nr:long-chain fatty acid--CoA ligase [Oscillospiraceae bacterium]
MRFSSFANMIGHFAERTPDAPALRYEEGGEARTMSFSQLAEAVARRTGELRREGKTCLGVFADGSMPCVVEIFAAVGAGMQVVLLDESVPTPLLRGLIPYTDVDKLWGDRELCDELSTSLTRGVRDGGGKMLFFTSGTTERSKAVVLTEQSLCASAYNGATLLPLYPEDTLLCMLPIAHVFGFVCGVLWGLSCGACVALGRGARHYMDDCAFFRPTAISLVPMLLGFLLKQNAFNDELRLMLIGAGDCPEALINAAKAHGVRVCFGYGLTETSSGVALSIGDDPYAMTVCPDDTITLAPDGEILIRGRTCMMKGYYKCPEDTNIALAGGALHTGDLGRFDEKERLFIVGRKKDMLVLPDGTKVFLPEAEAELGKLLGGGDFALALKDDRVTLAIHGDERSDAAIFDAIAPYQETRPIGQRVAGLSRQREPLPRTATGKIKRWELNTRL